MQGFNASKNSWGFPKGKVNEGEEPRSCAVREVFEKTGFNVDEHYHRGSEKKLQKFVNGTMARLYIVPDVPTDLFAPQIRIEIRLPLIKNFWDRSLLLSSLDVYTVIAATLNFPTDISDVMDALFSGSAFAGTGYSSFEKSQSTKPSAPSLSGAMPLPAPVLLDCNEQMVSTYSTQYAVHPPTTLRYCTSENI